MFDRFKLHIKGVPNMGDVIRFAGDESEESVLPLVTESSTEKTSQPDLGVFVVDVDKLCRDLSQALQKAITEYSDPE